MSQLRCILATAVLVVTFLVSVTGGVANGQTLQASYEIVHELGITNVKANPERVVVFDYGVLDSLDKLGIDVVGLPKSSVPSYLSKYRDAKYANVGTLQEPDFEAINALKPDLIIISGRTSAHYEQLSRLAPTVYMGLDFGDYIASVQANLRTLGRIFGVEDAVEAELARIQEALERVQSLSTDKRALVLLVTGGRANAYGPGSRYGFIYDELGLSAVDETIVAATHGQVISWEYVLVHDPDFLFVIDRDAVVSGGGGQTARQVVENQLVRFTKAYAQGNIVYLEPSYWYLSGGGLRSLEMMIDDIEQALLKATQ